LGIPPLCYYGLGKEKQMTNLEYLSKVQQNLGRDDRDRVEAYLIGALSVVVKDQAQWRQLCDRALKMVELRKTVEAKPNCSLGGD